MKAFDTLYACALLIVAFYMSSPLFLLATTGLLLITMARNWVFRDDDTDEDPDEDSISPTLPHPTA